MVAFFKSVPFGAFLTILIALFIGSAGSQGGLLNVFSFVVEGHKLFWSWPLFLAGTGLTWALMLMMGD